MKLLAIGNSFSEDAFRWLHDLADAAGEELYTLTPYIGGCTLEMHVDKLRSGVKDYLPITNGITNQSAKSSLSDALRSADWDFVAIQQASRQSAQPETYEPYLGELVAAVRECSPKAKLLFLQAWEYEYCLRGDANFRFFEESCDLMYGAIRATVPYFAGRYGLDIIPAGDAVRRAKRLPEFDSEHGGISLYRDSYHVGLTYGRYLLACVCFKKLYGRSPVGIDFAPEGAEKSLCELLARVADEVVAM